MDRFADLPPHHIFGNYPPQMVPTHLKLVTPGLGFDSWPNLQPWFWNCGEKNRGFFFGWDLLDPRTPRMIYLPTFGWCFIFNGKLVRKYTSPMDPIGYLQAWRQFPPALQRLCWRHSLRTLPENSGFLAEISREVELHLVVIKRKWCDTGITRAPPGMYLQDLERAQPRCEVCFWI